MALHAAQASTETFEAFAGNEHDRRSTRVVRRCVLVAVPIAALAATVLVADPSGATSTPVPGRSMAAASVVVTPPEPAALRTAAAAPDAGAIHVARRLADPATAGPADATDVADVAAPLDLDVRPLARPIVVLYGDSLAWEAADFFTWAFGGHPDVQVITRTFGGTAICDWLDEMAADAADLAPGAVVVEFSGNNLTPCMQDAGGDALVGEAYLAAYAANADAIVATFAPIGTQIVFAGAPISRAAEASGDFNGGRLNAMYERLADAHDGVRYVDAGASVLDGGRWTATLPCLPAEPCTGGVDADGRPVNVVRAPDGGHFCPLNEEAVRGVTGACAVWSSGAFRYAMAMADPVLDTLALVAT